MEDLLIVDDSENIRRQLKWGLGEDFAISLAECADEALAIARKQHIKVVVLDLGLPPHENSTEEGFRCLKGLLEACPAVKVIVVTGQNERENALRAIQLGAYDFYQKPIDLKDLKVIIKRAFYLYNIEEENKRLLSLSAGKDDELIGMVGLCPLMVQVFSTIRKIAPSDAPVLITGESGTGKEMAARAIHMLSLRKDAQFVAINCGAIPENLLESELFGAEKGSFTGASGQIVGKVEAAHGGTLFLDEIAEMPVNLQVKLLRFLQEKTIQRIGGRKDLPVDARIIAATNVDIDKAIKKGSFREDLYYRIGVITIPLPPLRDRGDDIPFLANLFLRKYCEKVGKKIKGFSDSTRAFMEFYQWPGNVRELENRVQRAVIMSEASLIGIPDLGFTELVENKTSAPLSLKEARDKIEREMLVAALEKYGSNMTKVSELLSVSRTTLYDLMKKHGIQNTTYQR